jgi:hypothetical protein
LETKLALKEKELEKISSGSEKGQSQIDMYLGVLEELGIYDRSYALLV